ncbi:MAG: GntR family transcriptional regulator [Erythrobacter sp.]
MPKTAAPSERKPPRYSQLASELRQAIIAGQLAVREALKRLQSEGLIAPRRGSGTTVQPAVTRGGALHIHLNM